jgi:ribosomal protein S12 methylthiotransferase accessory factor
MSSISLKELRHLLVGPMSLIRDLVEIRPSAGAPRIFNSSCVLSNTAQILGAEVPGSTGAAGLSRQDAEICAIGEAVERYAAAFIPWDRLIYATARELGHRAIGVDRFEIYEDHIYDAPGFPLARYYPDRPIYWTEAVSLTTKQTRYIPSALVYLPYQYRDVKSRSDFVGMGVSTGQACHSDWTAARLSGLYECIERDAFMITWTRGLRAPRLSIESNPRLTLLYDQTYANCAVDFHLFDLTLDIRVPTAFCIAISHGLRGPFAVVGCAARLSLEEACEKALLEAAQCLSWAHYLQKTRADWRPKPDFSNVVTFEDHVRLYCEPDVLRNLDFLMSSPASADIPLTMSAGIAVEDKCDAAIAAVSQMGYEALEADLTTPDLADLGLHVVKVMVPGLATLSANHAWPAMQAERYRKVPERVGRQATFERCNPSPHPFP